MTVKCPSCGSEQTQIIKEWDIQSKKKRSPKLHIKLYECEQCHERFRETQKEG